MTTAADDVEHVVIIGSGFGGAVVARRLSEAARAPGCKKNLKITVMERGRRFSPDDMPRLQVPEKLVDDPALQSSRRLPDAARMSWAHDQGLWQVRDLGGLRVATAAGLGGGSLIYAGVHLRAPQEVLAAWPEGYRRPELDRYYALVEQMLDVQVAPRTWTKTRRMEQVAGELKGQAKLFRPPLAITFSEPRGARRGQDGSFKNAFGAERRPCIGCGDCIIGCPHRSKNTLDSNYLHGIEDRVSVRTMTEVVRIDRGDGARSKKRFAIHFRDHLLDGRPDIEHADHVFLCAGALGSTEILFRSRESLRATIPRLGKHFYANGDAPGVVFDTREVWQPSAGPTITTSLFHNSNGHGHTPAWFLLQDGGVPPSLQRGLGFLRSRIWLGRNAFGDGARVRPTAPASHGEGGLLNFLGTLPAIPQMARNGSDGAARKKGEEKEDLLTSILPEALRVLLKSVEPPGKRLLNELTEMDHRVAGQLITLMGQRFPHFLAIPFVRWFAQGSDLPKATIAALVARVPALGAVRDAHSALSLGLRGLLDLVLGVAPTEHTAVLLAMGPDQRWTLDFKDEKEGLKVEGDTVANVRLYGLQERLMRDVARSLNGELRTNPAWTLGHRPMTVHAQGGCSMGGDSAVDVTSPDGLQVHGVPGLYVFDGAVFPTSVGVNPSHTIAAVAERNIERFIRTELGLPDWEAKAPDPVDPHAPLPSAVWNLPPPTRDPLTVPLGEIFPSAGTLPETAPPEAQTPGIEWPEVMDGFVSLLDEDIFSKPVAELEVARFVACETEGRHHQQRVRADLHATIADLEEALLDDSTTCIAITGTLELWQPTRQGLWRQARTFVIKKGTLLIELSAKPMPYMRYAITAEDGQGAIRLSGKKQLQGKAGMAAWRDVTTLYVRLEDGGQTYYGILRVPLLDIMNKQLPNTKITGDGISPARQTWLIARFARHFYGRLSGLYHFDWV